MIPLPVATCSVSAVCIGTARIFRARHSRRLTSNLSLGTESEWTVKFSIGTASAIRRVGGTSSLTGRLPVSTVLVLLSSGSSHSSSTSTTVLVVLLLLLVVRTSTTTADSPDSESESESGSPDSESESAPARSLRLSPGRTVPVSA